MSGSETNVTVVGTSEDMVSRMRAVMPSAWFPVTSLSINASVTPVLDGLLAGLGWGWSYCYALTLFVIRQARVSTASASFLDIISADFFGNLIKRHANEADDTFRSRIRANLLLPRATRNALINTITALAGVAPDVFEPTRAADTGGYGSASVSAAGGGGGYNTIALALGSSTMPFQYLVAVTTGVSRTQRESQASFIDASGSLQVVPRHVTRPLYKSGLKEGNLLETRSFNLIKDSMNWSGFTQSSAQAIARWVVDVKGSDALWAGMPVVQLRIYSGGQIQGPAVTVNATSDAVTGSVWILLPLDHAFDKFGLAINDTKNPDNLINCLADLSLAGKWQRLTVTTEPTAGTSRNVSMTLSGISRELMITPVLTQCWQLEPGSTATSYIPSNQQIGIREADNLIGNQAAEVNSFDSVGLNEAICRVIPSGSIAWTNLAS